MGKAYSYGIVPYRNNKGKIEILLNKTSKVSDLNFFKGKQNHLESIEDCARREFTEETGLIATDLEDYFYGTSKRKNIGVFLSNWNSIKGDTSMNSFDKREIFYWDWYDISENLVFSKNQQKIFEELKEKLNAKFR